MKSIALLSLASAALCAPTPEAEPIKVPLPRRRHAVTRDQHAVDPELYLGQLQYTLNKYGKEVDLLSGLHNILGRGANEHLNDQGQDELYYGNVNVGTQTFTIDFDTGSSDLFVPGPKCTKADGCTGTVRYNQHGTDEHNTTSVTYGSGSVSGENYFDSVTVAGLTATHQNVVSLTKATGFSSSKAEGLMGMAFQSIAQSKQPPFFQTLMAEKKVAIPEFSFYLGRESSGTGQNSELTLGGVDSSKYTGSFHKVPLNSETYWQVPVQGVVVNGKKAAALSGSAAIDTGTTIVIAPVAAAEAIYADIPGAIPVPLDGASPVLYAYPCSSKPNVAITFAGKNFAIAPEDFNLGSLTSAFASTIGSEILTKLLDTAGLSYCLGAIAGDELDPPEELYVVGDTFLKSWYAKFNFVNANGKPSVSFAKSV